MCGVLGGVIKNPTPDDFDSIRRLFIESSIRGLHATGMSWLKDNKILTIRKPIPADEFVDTYLTDDKLIGMIDRSTNGIRLIGHCRYSTSDLMYNQPIANKHLSIVHNGVITQEPYEKWESIYGYKVHSKNDSEILWQHINHQGQFPIAWFGEEASMSVLELHDIGYMRGYRNGKRPLVIGELENGYIFASTEDILNRTKFNGMKILYHVPKDVYVFIDPEYNMKTIKKPTELKDLQIKWISTTAPLSPMASS